MILELDSNFVLLRFRLLLLWSILLLLFISTEVHLTPVWLPLYIFRDWETMDYNEMKTEGIISVCLAVSVSL